MTDSNNKSKITEFFNEMTGGKGLMDLAKEHPDMAKGAVALSVLMGIYMLPLPNMIKYPMYAALMGYVVNKYVLPLLGTDGKELVNGLMSAFTGASNPEAGVTATTANDTKEEPAKGFFDSLKSTFTGFLTPALAHN